MANRTYVPDLASRLAMADAEARAAIDVQATGDGNTGDQSPSDDDSMQLPGRLSSRFIVHDDYAGQPDSSSHLFLGASDADLMDVDSNAWSTASEASTDTDRPFNSTLTTRTPHTSHFVSANAPTYENAVPEIDSQDPFIMPGITYYSDMYLQRREQSYLPFPDLANDPTLSHLREISSLASWTVSSYKPSCGVAALLNPSTATFWQSDGPQPHLLNIHFFKLVRIVKLRVYLDFELDESYTPTRLSFAAGTHEYDAVEFADWRWDGVGPKGWIDVDLSQCGSDEEREREQIDEFDEDAGIAGVLHCFFLQVRVLENHQNGKDTHIRGVQIFARDERARRLTRRAADADGEEKVEEVRQGLEEASWMAEPELR